MQPTSYTIQKPKAPKVPILVSVPHCGMAFPDTLITKYKATLIHPPDDTDFFVEQVYDFVGDLGITMIYAHYSRWVIDLNRSAENRALYSDGRFLTGLTPTTDFLGNPIYQSPTLEPDTQEIEDRKNQYYYPYYKKIETIITDFKKEFGVAVLWDAHSIRRFVPSISKTPFPEFILGTNDGQSASEALIQAAKNGLSNSDYEFSYNAPFKGGNITRHFGNPAENIHALQLEMIKSLYMDDSETTYHSERAAKLRKTLQTTFKLLIAAISKKTPSL